jgi:hypothetical protein
MNIKPICGISEFPYLSFVYVNNNNDENIPISYSRIEIIQTNNKVDTCENILEVFHEQHIFGKYVLHCITVCPDTSLHIDFEEVLMCKIFFNLKDKDDWICNYNFMSENIGFTSCNNYLTNFNSDGIFGLLNKKSNEYKGENIKYFIHIGDQVYQDAQYIKYFNKKIYKQNIYYIDEMVIDTYIMTWGKKEINLALSSVMNAMIPDDHDFVNESTVERIVKNGKNLRILQRWIFSCSKFISICNNFLNNFLINSTISSILTISPYNKFLHVLDFENNKNRYIVSPFLKVTNDYKIPTRMAFMDFANIVEYQLVKKKFSKNSDKLILVCSMPIIKETKSGCLKWFGIENNQSNFEVSECQRKLADIAERCKLNKVYLIFGDKHISINGKIKIKEIELLVNVCSPANNVTERYIRGSNFVENSLKQQKRMSYCISDKEETKSVIVKNTWFDRFKEFFYNLKIVYLFRFPN